jgi:glycine/D-amino acid oxidase-like deaminating enzyme
MSTAIIGAGIIGVSTAYYLSQLPQYTAQPNDPNNRIYLLDASPELFTSASGFAARFLAKDWFSPAAAALGALSFDLHRQLASEFNGRERWGYSLSSSISPLHNQHGERGDEWLYTGEPRATVAPRDGDGEEEEISGAPTWLKRTQIQGVETLSTGETTAQIDPQRLCKFLLEASLSRGVHLHHPVKPLAVITTASTGHITGLKVQSSQNGEIVSLPCNRLVIAAGAWSGRVFKTLFPSALDTLPVSSLAGHSLLVRSPQWTAEGKEEGGGGCHAVFTVDEAEGFSPELFSRLGPSGAEIYIAGLNHSASQLPLPDLPADAVPRDADLDSIQRVANKLVSESRTVRKALCFRPIITNRSTPIVARISDRRLGKGILTEGGAEGEAGGVFVATGHGPWGISMSLGTGKVVAEMVSGRKTSVNVSKLGW